jgi:hypothetical protein
MLGLATPAAPASGNATGQINQPHDPTVDPSQQAADNAAAPLIHFSRGSIEHTEPMSFGQAVVMTNAPQQLGPFDVPAFGYFRNLMLQVSATGGVGGGANVAAAADAPWNALQSVSIEDVNGTPIVGPFSGYDLYLANKWGGYFFNPDPAAWPSFSNVVTGAGASGNFTFSLCIPAELIPREALGALANQSTAQQFKVRLTLNASGSIYATAPATTLPSVTVKGVLYAWAQPANTDSYGNAQAQTPPALGTTAYWSKTSPAFIAGANMYKLPRVGNAIRNLIFVARDGAGVRQEAFLPDPFNLNLDGRVVDNLPKAQLKDRMARRFGIPAASVDNGVVVVDFCHDFDGHPGSGELRDLWLHTLQSSRLEVGGTWGGAGNVDIITNDVVAPAGVVL